MTDRDRLIELIHDSDYSLNSVGLADHLIANGIICLPCKVGQIVWLVRNGKIEETTVEKIVLKDKGLYLKLLCNSFYETSCRSIGKTVFFTREEAEKALERSVNND